MDRDNAKKTKIAKGTLFVEKYGWPKTHKILPKKVRKSIQEILCVATKTYHTPKELNFMIIKQLLNILEYE